MSVITWFATASHWLIVVGSIIVSLGTLYGGYHFLHQKRRFLSGMARYCVMGLLSVLLVGPVPGAAAQINTIDHYSAGSLSQLSLAYYRGLDLMGPWQQPWGGPNVFAGTKQLDYYKSKGLTTFRQPLLWEALQPVKFGPLNATYLKATDTFVANLKARGMQVSFTFINQGVYPATSSNVITGSDLADVWTKLAQHYKSEPTVWAYDLMNEPYKDNNWLSHAQQVINAIRKIDTVKPIIAMPQQENSNGYANFNGYNDPGHNLWYEAHTYFDRGSNGFYYGTYDQEGAYPTIGVDRAQPFVQWCWQHASVNGQMRCTEGEYGIPGGWISGDQYTTYGPAQTDPRWLIVLDNFLAYLDQNNISGTYWNAGPYGDINSVEPTNLGQDRPQMIILTKHLGSVAVLSRGLVHIGTSFSFQPNQGSHRAFCFTRTTAKACHTVIARHRLHTKMAHLRNHVGNVEPIHQSENPAIKGSQSLGSPANTDLASIFPPSVTSRRRCSRFSMRQ